MSNKTVACVKCGARLQPHWLKDGICNGCRNPHLIVTAQVIPSKESDMKQIGSQIRQKIEDTSYKIRAKIGNKVSLECGDHREVWVKHDHHAGYTLEIDGIDYEFVSSHYENSDF